MSFFKLRSPAYRQLRWLKWYFGFWPVHFQHRIVREWWLVHERAYLIANEIERVSDNLDAMDDRAGSAN